MRVRSREGITTPGQVAEVIDVPTTPAGPTSELQPPESIRIPVTTYATAGGKPTPGGRLVAPGVRLAENVTLTGVYSAQNPPPLEVLRDKIFAVHATRILPSDGLIHPGRLLDTEQMARWGTRTAPTFRPTTHFALGELVRPHGGGKHSWDDRFPYAVVLPLRAIEPQLVNLFTHDTYTVGDIALGDLATLVVPRGTDRSRLPRTLRVFEYDPAMPLRDAVDAVIERQNGWHLRMNSDYDHHAGAVALLDGENVNSVAFFTAFLRENPHVSFGTHVVSTQGEAFRFGHIDGLIRLFVTPTGGVSGLYSRPDFELGRSLMLHHVARLRNWMEEHASSECLATFNDAVANLHHWLTIIDARCPAGGGGSPVFDNNLREALAGLAPEELDAFIAAQAQAGVGFPNDLGAVYCVQRWLRHGNEIADRDGLRSRLTSALSQLGSDTHLFAYLEDNPDTGSAALGPTLEILRMPAVQQFLTRNEGITFAPGGPKDLEDVLRGHPDTKRLFEERPPQMETARRFMRRENLKTAFDSFASARSELWSLDRLEKYVTEFSTRPISDRRPIEDYGPGDTLPGYEVLYRREPAVATAFDRIGLGGQFRAAYQEPQTFWNERRTLFEVIDTLKH